MPSTALPDTTAERLHGELDEDEVRARFRGGQGVVGVVVAKLNLSNSKDRVARKSDRLKRREKLEAEVRLTCTSRDLQAWKP